MTASPRTRLVFRPEYGERDLDDARARGYLSHVFVQIDGGNLYPVFFYTPDRIGGDLQSSESCGEPSIAEVGTIIVREITLPELEAAVERAFCQGFFNYLVHVSEEQISHADPFHWPP
jgi:hypothetical protein